MKSILLFIKKHIFFWKNTKLLGDNNKSIINNDKEDFLNKMKTDEIKILDIKRRVENKQIKLEELSYEQQEMLLKAYKIQKENLEQSIANLNYKLNKISD